MAVVCKGLRVLSALCFRAGNGVGLKTESSRIGGFEVRECFEKARPSALTTLHARLQARVSQVARLVNVNPAMSLHCFGMFCSSGHLRVTR